MIGAAVTGSVEIGVGAAMIGVGTVRIRVWGVRIGVWGVRIGIWAAKIGLFCAMTAIGAVATRGASAAHAVRNGRRISAACRRFIEGGRGTSRALAAIPPLKMRGDRGGQKTVDVSR